MADFPGLKTPGSEPAVLHHWTHRASALETLLLRLCVIPGAGYLWFPTLLARIGIKQYNLEALLDFQNVIGPNESNPDSFTSHFAAVWTLKNIFHGIADVSFPM